MTIPSPSAIIDNDAGLTLVEALIVLAISGFVIIALGNLVWFVVDEQRRLTLSEGDIRQAAWFNDTIDRMIENADPGSIELSAEGLRLTSTGVPLSLARERAVRLLLPVSSNQGLQKLEMATDLSAKMELNNKTDLGGSILTDDTDGRRQPLLSQLTSLAIAVRSRDVWLADWQGRGGRPDAIRFSWQRVGGPRREHIAYFGHRPIETACIRDPTLASCAGSR